MTNKLTAKLSDGREFEVVGSFGPISLGVGDGSLKTSGEMQLLVKPLKSEPPKEVFLELKGGQGLQYINSYTLDGKLAENTKHYTRYVLAVDEPKQEKKAREWWFVHASGNSDPYCFFDKESEARDFCDRDSQRMKEVGMIVRYEVVHVREVLG